MNNPAYALHSAVLVTFIILTFIKSLDFMYLFQIKEYRFDRFISFIREEGFFNIFYTRRPRIPAKTIRNVLLMIISLFMILIFPLSLFEISLSLLILLMCIPMIAFFFVLIGVWVTSFMAGIQRNSIIDKAADKLKHSKATVIGVTGSYGKSSVKEFIYEILTAKYKTAKTDKNMNTDVGVSMSILKNLQPDTEYFIAEMGAYRIGEIKKICDHVHPKYGVLTAIGNQHLSLFGSKENIEKAKAELLESLPEDGKIYINAHIQNKSFFESKAKCRKTYYSVDQKSDINADNVTQNADKISANIHYKEHSFTIKTNLIGLHNVENLLPAIGLGIDLNIPVEAIQKTISELDNVESKLSMNKGLNKTIILNDAKNSNVEGFLAAIKTISTFPQKKKYVISKGIIELGSEKGESYKRIIRALNDVGCKLITTDNLFRKLSDEYTVHMVKNESEMLSYLKEYLDEESIIVIEGRFSKRFVESLL